MVMDEDAGREREMKGAREERKRERERERGREIARMIAG